MNKYEKKRTMQELKAERHQEWEKSLASTGPKPAGVVIRMPEPNWGKTACVLSERELEVLQLVSYGLSTAQIAEELFLSKHTVTNHRKNMLARSHCNTLAELVRLAMRENLL